MLKTLNMALKKIHQDRVKHSLKKSQKLPKNIIWNRLQLNFLIHSHVLLRDFNDFWREMLELLPILCSLSEKEVWDQRSEVRPWSACVTQRVITSSGWGQDAKALCPCAWYQRKNQDIMEVLGSSLLLNNSSLLSVQWGRCLYLFVCLVGLDTFREGFEHPFWGCSSMSSSYLGMLLQGVPS